MGLLELRSLRPEVEALTTDPARAELPWTVGQEARDVLSYWDSGVWPDR